MQYDIKCTRIKFVTHETPKSYLLRTRSQKCVCCRSNDQIRGTEKDGLVDLPRVPLVVPSFFVPRSGTLESLFQGVCKNIKTGRKNLSEHGRQQNWMRCLFSIAENACAKYPVVPVSINFANKNFQIRKAGKAYSPENEGYPFSRILRKSLGLRDTESPGVPVHN